MFFTTPPHPPIKKTTTITEEIGCFSIFTSRTIPNRPAGQGKWLKIFHCVLRGQCRPVCVSLILEGEGILDVSWSMEFQGCFPWTKPSQWHNFYQILIQFSSRLYLCTQKSPYALHPSSWKSPQWCLWNSANAWVIDNIGPSLSLQRRLSVFSNS